MMERLLLKNWWMFAFCLFSFIAYEQGLYQYKSDLEYLTARMAELQAETAEALALQENLKRQIGSQSDPAWIELTLMKELGVVPQGQKKVYFKS